jgi:hypothetical protein
MSIGFRAYLIVMAVAFLLLWPTVAGIGYLAQISNCNIALYSRDNYVAHCYDKGFADFEHEAYYQGNLGIRDRLRGADVLFAGTSRMQYAFSRRNVAPFFALRRASFFLAGFGYGEQWRFSEAMFARHKPHPKILIVNVDPFFGGNELSEPAQFILEHPVEAFVDTKFKAAVQPVYAALCHHAPATIAARLCGRASVIMRLRASGQWNILGIDDENLPGPHAIRLVAHATKDQVAAWLARAEAHARQLIAATSARCVVLTNVPQDSVGNEYAVALAARLGASLILPDIPLSDLRTYDGQHFDARSAIEWSNAFLQQLDPIGVRCGAW